MINSSVVQYVPYVLATNILLRDGVKQQSHSK